VIDAIEFTTMLRCLDPLSDAVFLATDLAATGRRDLADAYERAYLGRSRSDPDVRALLPLYAAYRAHVRAKVDAHTSADRTRPRAERDRLRASARRHLALSWGRAREGLPPPLVVLVGPSGVGKSVVANAIAPLLGADVLRSDVVRKALAGLAPTARVTGRDLQALYAPATSATTYAALRDGAARALRAGRPAIVDATYLRPEHRAPLVDLARRLGCAVAFVDVRCPAAVVRRRIAARTRAGLDPSDATFAVYRRQVAERRPFTRAERPFVVRHEGTAPPDDVLMPLLESLVSR
jgi:predicted kinase